MVQESYQSQKMVLDAFLLNTQHYNVSAAIQGKEYRSPQHLDVAAFETGAFGSPSTTVS